MKRSLFIILLGVICICSLSSFTKKDKTPKQTKEAGAYIFGFSASFTDSTVYFTPIQFIDSVALEKKTKFLPHCPEYSYQLKEYLESKQNEKNRVCATYSDEKKAKIEKLYVQMKKYYQTQKNLKVIFLSAEDFKFSKVEDEVEEEEVTEEIPETAE